MVTITVRRHNPERIKLMTTVYANDEKKNGTVGKRRRILAMFAVSTDAWSYINTMRDLHPTWIITYKERVHST